MKSLLPNVFFSTLLLCALTFGSCKKEKTGEPDAQNPPPTHFVKGYLGNEEIITLGTPSYFTDVSNQDSDSQTSGGHGNWPDLDDRSTLVTGCVWRTTDNHGNQTSTGSVELRKEVFRIYVTPFLGNLYYMMLTPGLYNFAYDHNSSSGAYVTMRDHAGALWTSQGDQDGSSFTILSRQYEDSTATITGAISCKMYNSSGDMKPLTSGTFTATVGLK